MQLCICRYNLGGDFDNNMGRSPFAKEAIGKLLTEVENNRSSVMVILAGYKLPMQRLLRMDPGPSVARAAVLLFSRGAVAVP